MTDLTYPTLAEMLVNADEYASMKRSPDFVVIMALPAQDDNFFVTYWYNDGRTAPRCLKRAV
jgi:hypothetical protein